MAPGYSDGMSEIADAVEVARLEAEAAASLDRDGYLLLRGAVSMAWIAQLRDAFEDWLSASPRSGPRPVGVDWRCMRWWMSTRPLQQVCRLPIMLAATHHILRQPFFLAHIDGREPCLDGAARRAFAP